MKFWLRMVTIPRLTLVVGAIYARREHSVQGQFAEDESDACGCPIRTPGQEFVRLVGRTPSRTVPGEVVALDIVQYVPEILSTWAVRLFSIVNRSGSLPTA